MRRFHRRGRGQALVEFALIAPLFILILLAVFDLGRGVFMYTSITNAAREGARLAIVNQDVATIRDRLVGQWAVTETSDSDGTKVEVGYPRGGCQRQPQHQSTVSDPHRHRLSRARHVRDDVRADHTAREADPVPLGGRFRGRDRAPGGLESSRARTRH